MDRKIRLNNRGQSYVLGAVIVLFLVATIVVLIPVIYEDLAFSGEYIALSMTLKNSVRESTGHASSLIFLDDLISKSSLEMKEYLNDYIKAMLSKYPSLVEKMYGIKIINQEIQVCVNARDLTISNYGKSITIVCLPRISVEAVYETNAKKYVFNYTLALKIKDADYVLTSDVNSYKLDLFFNVTRNNKPLNKIFVSLYLYNSTIYDEIDNPSNFIIIVGEKIPLIGIHGNYCLSTVIPLEYGVKAPPGTEYALLIVVEDSFGEKVWDAWKITVEKEE
ncbi:MAG: hypothetical protein DRJ52_04405 [Thermoprotei archaeon]|nr:MAG: hypothetical protein DRJ52_04405 [Thermoprotei archaeon]